MSEIDQSSVTPLDPKERKKRRREGIAIGLLVPLFIGLTIVELQLTRVSSTLPFVNSIFFFGLLNINIVILVGLVWLIFRNIGKIIIERRRKILGARLKTKLVMAFLGLSIGPTVTLFIISAMYINSSFDKWFSLKIQNTFQASLEITEHFYRSTTQTGMHFAEHLSKQLAAELDRVGDKPTPARTAGLERFLSYQRNLLALDAIEYYSDPLDERVLTDGGAGERGKNLVPRLSLDLLQKAFLGEKVTTVQHAGSGDLIRCLFPVRSRTAGDVKGVVAVSSRIPFNLVNRVDEIALVFDDYKITNPLKYPMKTTYLVILIMITLVILFVAIWIGLYLARELTDPVERLVLGAQAVGSGNLDVSIKTSGHDEIALLVEKFNKMTRDLRDNRERLLQTGRDLERRGLQLEAVLANVGTGVVAVDREGKITTFNRSVSALLGMQATDVLGHGYAEIFKEQLSPLADSIDKARQVGVQVPEVVQWNFHPKPEESKSLAAVLTPIREGEMDWGVVIVIEDMTLLVKGQREMAWREVARRIAHEIKNPLTPIKLSAQRLQRRLSHVRGKDGSLLQECTETIIRHTDELKELVNEFSDFARFPEIHPSPNDLNTALGEVLTLFQQAHPQIDFSARLESRLPVFDFDRDSDQARHDEPSEQRGGSVCGLAPNSAFAH